MCVCASFPLSLSLCVCRRKRVYLFCCSTLSLGFAIFACSMYVIFCTILVHRWFRLCLPLFPFRFIFFSSVIGVPSSFIAICFRCVVFLTSFYGVLSPPLWFKKKYTSLSCNLNCGFGCTAFSGWRVITHWDPNALLHYQIDSDKPMSCEAKICSFKVPLIYW